MTKFCIAFYDSSLSTLPQYKNEQQVLLDSLSQDLDYGAFNPALCFAHVSVASSLKDFLATL
jgi:hypothetical protein